MPALFTIAIYLMLAGGLAIPFTHLFWPQIIEGQVGKQNFVAHMIESWMRGDIDRGFPIRYFAEPWHNGPGPWAEEVPLFHWIAAGLGSLTGMTAVHAGRVTSFIFAIVLLFAVRAIAKTLFLVPPPTREAPIAPPAKKSMVAIWLAPALLVWLPGFQIYSASVIPDLAMLALIAVAYAVRLHAKSPDRPQFTSYAALMMACLLKYFAVFALLALFFYDMWMSEKSRTKWSYRAATAFFSVLAGAPTLAYLYYFITNHIPNPITEYMGSNGYGHLAGPFLGETKFYLRFVTWVFVKNPTIVLSLAALIGFAASRTGRQQDMTRSTAWMLIDLHFICYVLFALIFASSFYVHDYYALPFILPILFYGCGWLSKIKPAYAGLIVALTMGFGYTLSTDATFRLTNYVKASERVREALASIPDRTPSSMVIFSSDFSLPVLPILSKKAGWAFNAEHLDEQKADLIKRLADPATKAFVFYARIPGANELFEQWKQADPKLEQMKIVIDETYPSEGHKGSATRLVVMLNWVTAAN
ncbi:MAG: hypothetical protein JST80_04010 [Bdellovibrionales bacterium]|nr:hypothetical protein [Bdellovibrionales bacterium]